MVAAALPGGDAGVDRLPLVRVEDVVDADEPLRPWDAERFRARAAGGDRVGGAGEGVAEASAGFPEGIVQGLLEDRDGLIEVGGVEVAGNDHGQRLTFG